MKADAPKRAADSANALALSRLLAVEPEWIGLVPAAELVELPRHTILHAGPPLADPCAPPPTILNAAVIACLYEGWAEDDATAERMIRSGAVTLASAPDRGVVTPLAAVVSPSMPLQVVADARDPARRAASPLSSGAGPQLRFGARDPEIVERLRWRERTLASVLRLALTEPIPLFPIAAAALAGGDDLHGRTSAATFALEEILAERIGAEPGFVEVRAHIERSPLFFVSLWMAACRCILRAAEGIAGCSIVTAMSGNGDCFGIQLGGRPDSWATAEAGSPQGPLLDPSRPAKPSGAIGDSAVIDALGFGGQAMSFAPEVVSLLGPYVPRGAAELPDELLLAPHPAFAGLDLRVGLDARRVVATGKSPVVTLAIIDANGQGGLIGRGTYRPPVSLFADACARL